MRKSALAFIFVVIVVIGIPVFAGTLLWARVTELHRGYRAPEQFVEIPPGASTPEIGRRLIDAGVVKDAWTFRAAVWWTGDGTNLKAGEYRFDRPVSAVDVVRKDRKSTRLNSSHLVI